MIHKITERTSPASILLRCSCGWMQSITRAQNALARAAKVRAAIAKHLKEKDGTKMKRFLALALFALAACDEHTNTTEPPPAEAPWACEDLKPASAFSWWTLFGDTLVAVTVSVDYPDIPCETDEAIIRWRDARGYTYRPDGGAWTILCNGRREATSWLTRADWAAHGPILRVTWFPRTSDGPGTCGEIYDTLIGCPSLRAEIPLKNLLPSRR